MTRSQFSVLLSSILLPLALALTLLLNPRPAAAAAEDELPFMERAQTQQEGGLVVTTAVPSAQETRAVFGLSLYAQNIQPVWLQVENTRDTPVMFLAVGLDEWYFTPIESASLSSSGKAGQERKKLFLDRQMSSLIEPGARVSGYLFTRLDQGTKSFNVDFVAAQELISLTFFVPVPGLRIDHQTVDWNALYAEEDVVELGPEELKAALEAMPCCTTDKKSKGSGDPLNLAVIGKPADVYYAFIRAGWDETEVISASSLWKMSKSFLSGSENRYSPVSGLYVLDRPQDVAFQKARDNLNERNHLRLWMTPMRYQGVPVWIGQISRDIGVRLTRKTITTHKVDPDVDETREYLVENLAYSQALKKIGYVEGVGAASIESPRGNLTGDPYFTDGLRAVLWVTSEPMDFAEIGGMGWGIEPTR